LDQSWHFVKNFISLRGQHRSVYTPRWIDDCIEAGKLLEPTPQHLVHQSEQLREKLSSHYDAYGDSYTESATVETLGPLLAKMERGPAVRTEGAALSTAWKQARARIHDEAVSNFGADRVPFLGVVAFVDRCQDPTGSVEEPPVKAIKDAAVAMLKTLLCLHGARVQERFVAAEATHVVVPIQAVMRADGKAVRLQAATAVEGGVDVVTAEWVHVSIADGVRFPEGKYRVSVVAV